GRRAHPQAIEPQPADRPRGTPRGLLRALEIHAAPGLPPTRARASTPPPWSTTLIGLDVPLAVLDQRIESRVTAMIDGGWVEEVARIRREFPAADMPRLGHGHPELAAHLEGRLSLAEARQSTGR